MACYEPEEAQPIDFHRNVRLKKHVKGDVETVKQWVEQWNGRFQVREETLPAQFRSKRVETTGSPLRRLLLETFQYLELREIEQLVAFVCKEWFHVTRDNELWKTIYLAEFQPSDTSEEGNYRTKFVVQSQECCWLCRKVVSSQEIKLICPVRKRPLCRVCANTDDGCIVTLNSYFNSRKIAYTLVARLGFRHFIYDRFKQNYLTDLAETILPYAEQRKQALLAALQPLCPSKVSEEVLHVIATSNLRDFYMEKHPGYGSVVWALGVFCGLDDEKERFEENVTDFLSLLKYYGRYFE